jgi:hypothetical protein
VGLRLVNTAPGDISDPIKPGQPVHLGLKSESLSVVVGDIQADVAMSGIAYSEALPEADGDLATRVLGVALESPERIQPYNGEATRSIVSSRLSITKTSNSQFEKGIYEIQFSVEERASVLAHFKFRKKTWTLGTYDWANDVSQVAGLFFGLENGIYNTAIYAFLRGNGAGAVLYGGPQQEVAGEREGQDEAAWSWTGLSTNAVLNLYLVFNALGYSSAPAIGVPTDVPLVEIWGQLPSDTSPVVLAYIPIGSLGQFPAESELVSNKRAGPSNTGTIYFGVAGATGDELELEDWSVYPDFRFAVRDGNGTALNALKILPDAPVRFHSKDNVVPTELSVGKWQKSGTAEAAMKFAPGVLTKPMFFQVVNDEEGATVFFKDEPRIEQEQVDSLDGFMVEAFCYGEETTRDGDSPNIGFGIKDGAKDYQLCFLQSEEQRTVGVYSTGDDTLVASYHLPATDVDWTSPKLYQLVVDRRRGELLLYVEGVEVLSVLLSETFPTDTGDARVYFGHPRAHTTKSKLNLTFLNYLPRFRAWEGEDGDLPSAAPAAQQFTLDSSGTGSSAMSSGVLSIGKTSLAAGSKRFYKKSLEVSEFTGFQVDFSARVKEYANSDGTPYAPNSGTGVGLTVRLGTKRVDLRFYDCGFHGKKVGIVPGSGSESDILSQSALGKRFSATFDWSVMESYRLIVKGYDAIELWANTIVTSPLITIPWDGAFDVPLDSDPIGLVFGHFDADKTSISEWSYVRWGLSNGYEMSILPAYPEGFSRALFGGRLFLRTMFNEV